jgi:hypothetical protein
MSQTGRQITHIDGFPCYSAGETCYTCLPQLMDFFIQFIGMEYLQVTGSNINMVVFLVGVRGSSTPTSLFSPYTEKYLRLNKKAS